MNCCLENMWAVLNQAQKNINNSQNNNHEGPWIAQELDKISTTLSDHQSVYFFHEAWDAALTCFEVFR